MYFIKKCLDTILFTHAAVTLLADIMPFGCAVLIIPFKVELGVWPFPYTQLYALLIHQF